MSISTTSRPKLMVGVPAGYLSPRLPFPPNVSYNVAVGVELAPGLGVSLDGKALLVGAEGHQGRTEVTGHLVEDDGKIRYPQRDTVVLRGGDETVVDGYHDWQDYSLKGNSSDFAAAGDTPVQSFTVKETEDGLRVGSPYAARAWTVTNTDQGVTVHSDFDKGERFTVTTDGNVTTVDSNFDDQDFTVTRTADGGAVIDGHLKPEDFTFSKTDKGYDLQGYYPQQHFAITQA